jgi:ElaB/YqjD/DUF883 family membrane-anchored ribosome-binding protein
MGKRTGPVKDPGTSSRSRRPRQAAAGTEAAPVPADELAPVQGADAPGPEQPSEIRQNIEETRAQMGGTLGELQERLSPGHVKEQVRESVKETIDEARTALRAATVGKVETMIRDTGNTLSEARQSLWETVRENPVPAALSAIGLTWLFLNRGGRGGSRRYVAAGRYEGGFEPDGYGRGPGNGQGGLRTTAESAVRDARERASEVAGSAQQKASELASRASETAERMADQAQVQVRRVEQAMGRWMDENPLAVGAVALAAGTAIGLALPRTEGEDRILGTARDTVVNRAEELASQAVDTVRERLTDAQEQQTH